MTVANKPGHRGEHEGNRKTIARGMPGDAGVTVVTMLVCFFILHARLRARRAPGIPCALSSRAGLLLANSGEIAPRECGGVSALTSPRLRGEVGAKRRVRGPLIESELGETPPHPNPLPASGAREQASIAAALLPELENKKGRIIDPALRYINSR